MFLFRFVFLRYFIIQILFIFCSVIYLCLSEIESVQAAEVSSENVAIGIFQPGENIALDEIRVTFLGTAGVLPSIRQASSSILIETSEEKILLDAGNGALINLVALQVPLYEINKIFISHMHIDHIADLPSLWLAGWVFGRNTPLNIWVPYDSVDHCDHVKEAYRWDLQSRLSRNRYTEGSKLKCVGYSEGTVYDHGALNVTAFAVKHFTPEHSHGFRIDYKNRSFVYSGDTAYSENVLKYAAGVDVLVHESIIPEIVHRKITGISAKNVKEDSTPMNSFHTPPKLVGKVFARSKPRLGIVFHTYHSLDTEIPLINAVRSEYKGEFRLAKDFMVLNIGEEIRVREALPSPSAFPAIPVGNPKSWRSR